MGPQRFHGGRQSCLVYSRRSLRRYPDLTAQTDVNNPAVPSWLMQVALTQMKLRFTSIGGTKFQMMSKLVFF